MNGTAPSSRPKANVGRLVVLFDRDCGVCQWIVRQLARWDRAGRFDFLALQEASGAGRPLLVEVAASHPLERALHVVDEAFGTVAVGGDAVLAILDALPGGRLLRPWARLKVVRLAVDAWYRIVAHHRTRIGLWLGIPDEIECPIPPSIAVAGER
jgi:predicted DCC family thiol-disulfide oxidoreductase YuxK